MRVRMQGAQLIGVGRRRRRQPSDLQCSWHGRQTHLPLNLGLDVALLLELSLQNLRAGGARNLAVLSFKGLRAECASPHQGWALFLPLWLGAAAQPPQAECRWGFIAQPPVACPSQPYLGRPGAVAQALGAQAFKHVVQRILEGGRPKRVSASGRPPRQLPLHATLARVQAHSGAAVTPLIRPVSPVGSLDVRFL